MALAAKNDDIVDTSMPYVSIASCFRVTVTCRFCSPETVTSRIPATVLSRGSTVARTPAASVVASESLETERIITGMSLSEPAATRVTTSAGRVALSPSTVVRMSPTTLSAFVP